MRNLHLAFGVAVLAIAAACSGKTADVEPRGVATGGASNGGASGSSTGGTSGSAGTTSTGGSSGVIIIPEGGCPTITCESLGWACGYTLDECGNEVNCGMCGANEVCAGGLDTPTVCMTGGAGECPVCSGIPDCAGQPQLTILTGRVITPGRDDLNTGNQVGVPNATVYIMRTSDVTALPPMPTGIPADGLACDRCTDQNLGPVLAGGVTDATGAFTINEYVPVGVEIVLVVKVGRFRRATTLTLPMEAACQTTALPATLPDNPTRLPRNMMDGLAVNIPRIAVSTGGIDAMECVLEKMGLAHSEWANPGATGRIHLFRGGDPMNGMPPGSGARMDDMTPHADTLYGTVSTMLGYDLVVSDCEGQGWDSDFSERTAMGASVVEFVNRGGRMFASHLSYSWLHENGMTPYAEKTALTTGLGLAGTWATTSDNNANTGVGVISVGRPSASPRVQNFADWMVNEMVTTAPAYDFMIREPRSTNLMLGPTSEEFVYQSDGTMRVQQFSFNTPYGAPEAAACGRVAYSGFHVSAGTGGGQNPFADVIFPAHCTGDLTAQEKVLLYMLFDLGACIGDVPPPPDCDPQTCETLGAECGFTPDGCGAVLDCGPCRPPS